MHQTMSLAAEDPTIEKLVKEVKHASTQSAVEVVVVQVELENLHSKITILAK